MKREVEIHLKGWGHEIWIMNFEKYCGKILVFNSGKKCSWHYHKEKEETFYVAKGSFKILYGPGDDLRQAESLILSPGEAFHVMPTLRHQMIALEDSELFEISSTHNESDSYRVEKGD